MTRKVSNACYARRQLRGSATGRQPPHSMPNPSCLLSNPLGQFAQDDARAINARFSGIERQSSCRLSVSNHHNNLAAWRGSKFGARLTGARDLLESSTAATKDGIICTGSPGRAEAAKLSRVT